MAVVFKQRIGAKIFLFRRGNYSYRKLMPLIERGSFRCFTASWQWGQIEWSLGRWN